MKTFKIKSPVALVEGQHWYNLNGFTDEFEQPTLATPTHESMESRHLVWELVDNSHNRNVVRRDFHNCEVSSATEVVTPKVVLQAPKQVAKEPTDEEKLSDDRKEREELMDKLKNKKIPFAKSAATAMLRSLLSGKE